MNHMPDNNELAYKEILNIAPSIILGLDKKGDIFLLNKRGCEILGYERDEIIGKNWFSTCLQPETVPEVKKVFKRLMAGEAAQAKKVENKVVMKSGRIIDIFWHNIILNDDKQAIIGTLSSGEDITDYKKQEEELRLMNQALENSPVMAYRIKIGKDGWVFDYISENKRQIGYTREEMLVADPLSFLYPDDRERVLAELGSYVQSGAVNINHEYRMITKDGQIHWINSLAEIVRNDKGDMQYLQGVFIDITERMEAEEKMKEATIILENTPAVLYRVDLKKEGAPIVFISDNIRRYGYEPEDFINGKMTTAMMTYPDDLDRIMAEMEAFAKTDPAPGVHLRQEYRVFTKDKKIRQVEDFSEIVRDANGVPAYYQGLALDITERKDIEEKLKERTEELEKINKFMINRELKMAELKEKLKHWEEGKNNESA
jgi:PAS domain S-box-containing protein